MWLLFFVNMGQKYINVAVQEISLTTTGVGTDGLDGDLSNDIEVSDNGWEVEKAYSEEQKGYLLSLLTKRQQQVAVLLFDGYIRTDIARNLIPAVCVQAVHQIILRIRKRLNKKAGIHIESRHTKNGRD